MGFSYHEKGYRPRPIALFIARVRVGPRGDGSARAYLYFLRFIIECTTSLGSLLVATDTFLASGDLKTRLTQHAGLIDRSIFRSFDIYTCARKRAKPTERNGRERVERDEKNHLFIHSKTERNGTETGLFFDSYCIYNMYIHVQYIQS